MLAFVFLALPSGIENHNDKNQKSQSDENDHAGPGFPNLLYATRKLGPIHFIRSYTVWPRKPTLKLRPLVVKVQKKCGSTRSRGDCHSQSQLKYCTPI